MPATPTESTFELATIQRLQALGYRYLHASALERPLHAVVLEGPLRDTLRRRYAHLPAAAIEQVIQVISAPEGATLDRRNMAFQRLLREGYTLRYEAANGEERHEHLYFLDFQRPELNDFLVVNQLTVQGGAPGNPGNTRRPDLVITINGLPLVVFELKNPWDEYVDVAGAHNQLGHYTVDIPQLFNFNAFCVVSDGNTTLHGMHAAGFEWFAPWKSIEMVFTQMTKRDLLAFGTSGDGIANFDVLTIDYDPIDEQFDQLSALGKGQVFQSRLDALAKVLNPGSYGSQVKVFLRLSLQLTQLLLKTLSGSHKFLSFALELVHGDNLSQISFEQTRLLALQLRQGLLKSCTA